MERAATGKQPCPSKGNKSRNSQLSPDLGRFSLIRKESSLDFDTSDHKSVEDGSWADSDGAKSSPNLADAKYAVVASAQNTCFDMADHDEIAIR